MKEEKKRRTTDEWYFYPRNVVHFEAIVTACERFDQWGLVVVV
jgi:hypothetical protein